MSTAATRRRFLKQLAGRPARLSRSSTSALDRPDRRPVKYMTWWWAEKGRNEAWRGIVKKFHDSQKDIRIQEVGFPYSEYFQRVTTQLAGGRLDADVVSLSDELAVRMVKGNYLIQVDDIPKRLGFRTSSTRRSSSWSPSTGASTGCW